MKFLSKKEISALAEILVGSLCVYNYYLTDFFDEKLLDTSLFKHRCFSISLAFVMFFNALGTWFWFSVIRTTKLLNRIHKVLVYLSLNIALLVTHFSYKSNYSPIVRGYFDQKIFFDEIDKMQISLILLIVILLLSLAIIGINVLHIRFRITHMLKKKKQPKTGSKKQAKTPPKKSPPPKKAPPKKK
ncbi:hypothetical protein DOY81_002428 [Sarcophaga bullata]|nr:hypothetical protein DOY81_002428 [Sarcophaga bullata]